MSQLVILFHHYNKFRPKAPISHLYIQIPSLVFEYKGGKWEPWDGTYYNDGKELPVGTYYYIIDLNTGDAPQTGPVTIIR